jgi:hypothetical protein
MTLATVLTVGVPSHEDTGTAGSSRTFTTETSDLARFVNLVKLEDGHLDFLTLVLDLLGRGVSLLLTLLTTTQQFGIEVEGGVVLDTVGREGLGGLERLASERKALERGINAYNTKTGGECGVPLFAWEIFFLLPSRAEIMVLTLSTVVAEVTSKARVLPARDLTKSCMVRKRRKQMNGQPHLS